MKELTKIRIALSKLIAKFSDINTDKGVLTYPQEGDLLVGMEVYTVDEAGEYVVAEDGDYTLEDGKVIKVVEGKVAEILEPETDVEPEEVVEDVEVDAACKVKAEEETPVEDPVVETDGVKETDIDAIHKEINELYSLVGALIKEVQSIKEKGDETKETVEKMSKVSAAFSAEVEMEKSNKSAVFSGDAAIDRKLKNFGI